VPYYKSTGFVKANLNKGIDLFQFTSDNLVSYYVHYIINSKFRKSVQLKHWLKDQIRNRASIVVSASTKIKSYSDPDKQVVAVLAWVRNNVKYVPDILGNWKMTEHWNTAEETLTPVSGGKYDGQLIGDCEDFAILTYVLCRIKGVAGNRLYIIAGDVQDPNYPKSEIGHAWLSYKPMNYPFDFIFLDGTYYSNLNPISQRPVYSIFDKDIMKYRRKNSPTSFDEVETEYHKIWFLFNEYKAQLKIKLLKK